MTEERKLATIRIIDEILPIEGADSIEVLRFGGWKVVSQKDFYKQGDKVIFCEIDSWIPHHLAPFLCKGKEPREYKGIKGERLKSIRLRGQISQGLVLPLDCLGTTHFITSCEEGYDVTDILGIIKWEKPIPACLSGTVKGNFPTHLFPKTDAERIQNIKQSDFDRWCNSNDVFNDFTCTEKLEGTSFSCYFDGAELRVCSRNLELKETDDNLYWQIAKKYKFKEILRNIFDETCNEGLHGDRYAIQGEIVGPNVQDNIYNLKEHELYIFSIYDIKQKEYLPFERVMDVCDVCNEYGWKYVPLIDSGFHLINGHNITTKEHFLAFAEGKSKLNPNVEREGIVFFSYKKQINFKVISNKYLLGEK